MKQNSVPLKTNVSPRAAMLVVLGCVLGAYAATAAITAGRDGAEVASSIPVIAAVETMKLAEKDAEISDLGSTVEMLEAENAALASENVELLSDLATVLIEKTRLEASASVKSDPAFAIEKAAMTQQTDIAGIDAAIEPTPVEGEVKTEKNPATDVVGNNDTGEMVEVDTASTYLALLQGRYAALNAEGTADIDLGSLAKIIVVLDDIDREALLFAEGMKYDLTDAQRDLYEQYRVALLSHQSELMPQLRDAFGPAMRAKFGDQGYSMVTSGKGYRSATLKSDQFFSTTEIEKFHAGIHEWMVRMRFKEAVYMNADGTQIHGAVDLKPIPDDSLLINDSLIANSIN